MPWPDWLDVVHALWIDWQQTTTQTAALLAVAGALEEMEPDAHETFDAAFAPPAPARGRTPEEIEQRHALIAQLAAQ